MHFAGKVWRLLVGIKDALVLVLVLAFFWLLFTLLTMRPSPGEVREGALLVTLDGFVVEEMAAVNPVQALLAQQAPVAEYQARDLVRALEAAARDERIEAVVFDLDRFLGGGQVHLAEIGEAMARVRASGKPVLTYATAYGDDALLLASHASEIWVSPQGGAMVTGPGGANLYYAGLLEKLKVTAHVYKAGLYKSAVEPFTRADMSPEARENARALYGALWEEYRATVAKARPQARLAQLSSDPLAMLRAAGGDLARASLNAGLVDKIGSRDAFNRRVAAITGPDEWSDLPGAWPATELDAWLAANPAPYGGRRIGVVTVAGEIVDGEAGPGSAGGDRIAALLDEAYAAGDLAALVVRVDSPGGSVLASEVIREAIARHHARKIPVVVSMANLAASGGYWIATSSDRVFAQPETITGSIGVFGVLPSFEGTAALLGVTSDGVRTTPLSGQPDLVGGFSPEVDAIAQAGVEDSYRDFLVRVARARKMTPAAVDRIAQGRVWDGGAARQVGLVDQYGGLPDALDWAARAAKLKDGEWHADFLGEQEFVYDSLLRRWLTAGDERHNTGGRDALALIAGRQDALMARIAADARRLGSTRGMQAYCLECPVQARQAPVAAAPPRGWLAQVLSELLG